MHMKAFRQTEVLKKYGKILFKSSNEVVEKLQVVRFYFIKDSFNTTHNINFRNHIYKIIQGNANVIHVMFL